MPIGLLQVRKRGGGPRDGGVEIVGEIVGCEIGGGGGNGHRARYTR